MIERPQGISVAKWTLSKSVLHTHLPYFQRYLLRKLVKRLSFDEINCCSNLNNKKRLAAVKLLHLLGSKDTGLPDIKRCGSQRRLQGSCC